MYSYRQCAGAISQTLGCVLCIIAMHTKDIIASSFKCTCDKGEHFTKFKRWIMHFLFVYV